jgi:hypothetical protein
MIVVDGANVKRKYEETYGDGEGMVALEAVYKFWKQQFDTWRVPPSMWQVIIPLKRSWSSIRAVQTGGGLMDTEDTAALERLRREAPGVVMEIPDGHRDNDDRCCSYCSCSDSSCSYPHLMSPVTPIYPLYLCTHCVSTTATLFGLRATTMGLSLATIGFGIT